MPVIPATTTDERLRTIVATILQLEPGEIADDASFYDDLGADSLEKVAITAEIEMKFGVTLSTDEAAGIFSIADARSVLAAKHSDVTRPQADPSVASQAARATTRTAAGTSASESAAVDLVQRLVGRHVDAGHGADRAYLDPDVGSVSYAELHRAAASYAAALDGAGVAAGSRCLVLAEDSVATVIAILGLWWHGCVPVPVSPAAPQRDLEFILADCAAGAVHLDGTAVRRSDPVGGLARPAAVHRGRGQSRAGLDCSPRPGPVPQRYDWAADAEVLVQYTSGSTGAAKGVRQSASGVLRHARPTGRGDAAAT